MLCGYGVLLLLAMMAVHLVVAGDVFGGVLVLLSFFPRDVLDMIWG